MNYFGFLNSFNEESNNINFRKINFPSAESINYLQKDKDCSKYLKTLINDDIGEILINPDTKELIGYVFVNNKKDKGFIFNLEVMKKYRGHGFGTILLNDAINKYHGYDLTVAKDNEIAVKMYKKRGFKIDGDGNSKKEYYMKLPKKKLNEDMNNSLQDNDLKNAMTFIENKKPSQIYLVSDIHFYKNETANKKPDTELKMKKFLKECKKLGSNDVLIFLGDIGHVRCTFEQNNKIKNLLKNTECKKILVKGNHDCLSNNYYKECGFIYVVDYLPYKNIIFTHIPVIWDHTLSPMFTINNQICQFNDYKYPKQWANPQVYNANIHGHIHGSGEYWETDKKGHYDVWRDDHSFVRLDNITRDRNWREHFDEEYEPPMSLKEIKQKYGNKLYNKLKLDPVHKWRAETGIELVHKEPSAKELERIMKNWEMMDDKRKRLSDEKSMELFGCRNIDHYNNLIKTYNESINFPIKVYHASKDYYKKLKSAGLDFGNAFQEEGFSLYTWTKYKSAIGWGCFEVLKTLKKIDENITILGCKNSQNPIITKSVYNYLKDNLHKYDKKLLEFYIYTIRLNSDMELGIGHSSNTPNCITIRQTDDIDYSKVEKYQMTIDMLKKNCMIVEDNYIPTKKDIGVNRRLLTPFMTKDYMYQTSTKKQLSNDLKIGKLTPNNNLHDYLIDNNMELKKIKMKDRFLNETPLETRLTDIRSNFEKEVTLYHGTDHRIPNKIIDPAYGRINVGTRLSGPRYSTWWTKNPFFPFYYCCSRINTDLLYKNGYIPKDAKITLLNMFELTKHYFCVDGDNEILYISKILKKDFIEELNKNPGYIYKVTVPWKLVGRGHDNTLDEYTLDIPVKAEEIIVDYKTLIKYLDIRFVSEAECVLRATKIHDKNGDLTFKKVPLINKLIYHRMENRRVKYSKMYNNDLTRRKQEK